MKFYGFWLLELYELDFKPQNTEEIISNKLIRKRFFSISKINENEPTFRIHETC